MRVDKFMRWQQRGLAVPNSDSVKPAKPFIPDKYNNRMELNKLKRLKYFNKSLLEIRDQSFSEEEVSSCANITAEMENLVMWNKALPTYREGDAV